MRFVIAQVALQIGEAELAGGVCHGFLRTQFPAGRREDHPFGNQPEKLRAEAQRVGRDIIQSGILRPGIPAPANVRWRENGRVVSARPAIIMFEQCLAQSGALRRPVQKNQSSQTLSRSPRAQKIDMRPDER